MRSTRSKGLAQKDFSQFSFEPPKKLKRDRVENKSEEPKGNVSPDKPLETNDEVSTSKVKRKSPKSPIKIQYESEKDGESSKWMPENWELILDNIREMRKNADAPVDTMGCDTSHDLDLAPKVRRYHILVSLMLSSQTKDEVNFAAMTKLREHGLTIDSILKTSEDTLGKLIYGVGFWKTKAKNILRVTQILRDEYNDDIPNTIETLCKLPGVGPKMAHIAMNVAWGIVTGIGVDTHVHRISNRLKWVPKETKTPEATRVALEAWLPKDLWSEVNHLLVGFGQTQCRPVNPLCESCLNKDICPSSLVKHPKQSKKPRKKSEK